MVPAFTAPALGSGRVVRATISLGRVTSGCHGPEADEADPSLIARPRQAFDACRYLPASRFTICPSVLRSRWCSRT
jgi:hypothetical protein